MRPEQHRKRATEEFQEEFQKEFQQKEFQNENSLRSQPGRLPLLCGQVQADLPAFLDEDLSISRRQEVQRHLDSCEACRAELATYRDLERTLSRARLAIPAAGDLRAGFYARLAATEPAQGSGFDPFRRWMTDWRVLIPTLTAASLLIGLWQGQRVQMSGNNSQETVPLVAQVSRSEQKRVEQKRVEQKRVEQKRVEQKRVELDGGRRLDIATAPARTGSVQAPSSASLLGTTEVLKRAPKITTNSRRSIGDRKPPLRETPSPLVVASRLPERLDITKSLSEANIKASRTLSTVAETMPQQGNRLESKLENKLGGKALDSRDAAVDGDNTRLYGTATATQNRTSLVVLVDEGIDIQVKDRVRDFTDGMHGNSLEYTSTGKRILNITVGDE